MEARFYADDSQSYAFSTPDASESSDERLLTRLHDVAIRVASGQPQVSEILNPSKSQFMRCARRLGDPDISPAGHIPLNIPTDISPSRTNPPLFLHNVGHFPLPPPPSANLQYKAIYR